MIRTSTALLAAGALATAGIAVAAPASASVAACGNASLAVTATREQGATGHANFVLLFRNKTQSACSLYGYPGLDALSATGQVLAHAKRTLVGFTGGSRHGLQTIVVRPGR
ncbi:MAG TPA: DUF4232 domain-containing protein, partial [Jatrophihabitans sp.]|nr:DUF4232 domain-containing protein [Jatrophihabitans sp.]